MQDRPGKKPATLYDTDFFAWTQEQVRVLRDRRFDDLDLEHLIEEVEGVGAFEKREIRSRLTILLSHLLKWTYQPHFRSASWTSTIAEQRDALADLVETSPSLQGYLLTAVAKSYSAARNQASRETGMTPAVFPKKLPFAARDVLDPEFVPAEPPGT